MRLTVKLPLLVAGSVAAVALGGLAIAIPATERSVRRESLAADRHSLAAFANAVTSYLRIATSVLEVTASDDSLVSDRALAGTQRPVHGRSRDAARARRARARAIVRRSGVFDYVAIVGRHGQVLLLEPHALRAAMSSDDWAFLSWLREAMSGRTTVISDLHISPVTQAPSVVIAVPIKGARGRVIGALAGSLRLDRLSDLASADAGEARTGYGLITDGRGLVLAHQSNPNYVRYQTDFGDVFPVRRALAGHEGFGAWRDSIDGEKMLGAYRRLTDSRWTVTYATPERIALAPARRLAATLLVVWIASVVVIGSACMVIAFRVVRPLGRLRDAVNRAAIGDPTQHAAVNGHDEVAILSNEFNDMLDALGAKDAELKARASALEDANGELEAFSYSVSHDLRAPLRVIDGFSQRVLTRYADDLGPDGRHALERVRAGSQRMGLLIDETLKLSRLGRRTIRRERVDLSQLAREIADELQAGAERSVDFTVESDLTVEGDRELLRALLTNLLANAFKYTAETARARVEFGAHQHNGEPVYVVSDNGVGFDMAYADKLFRPFERLHGEDRFPGTGVGLAIVQRAVRRHGGRVWAASTPGEGATFSFTLGATSTPAEVST